MNEQKNVAVWLDHSKAQLIDNQTNEVSTTIYLKFDFDKKEEALRRSENIMHNKEQQAQSKFYKQIAALIIDYDNILLFGPTEAKLELQNFLKKDKHYAHKQIVVHSSDQMTLPEKFAFVKSYFKKELSHSAL
jgi:stalled ribosome rescue protein Dom34